MEETWKWINKWIKEGIDEQTTNTSCECVLGFRSVLTLRLITTNGGGSPCSWATSMKSGLFINACKSRANQNKSSKYNKQIMVLPLLCSNWLVGLIILNTKYH